MGGFGSGRDRYATTPTVAASFTLPASDLKPYLESHRPATWRWGDADDPRIALTATPEATATADDVDADRADATDRLEKYDGGPPARAIRLQYSVSVRGGDPAAIDDRIAIAYTTPPMGGLRARFVCPGCGERRDELHLPPWDHRPGKTAIRFRCRDCHDLGYETSRAAGTNMKEARLRYERAFARADADGRRPHPEQAPYTPERPKGRHESTHEELVQDVRAARVEWDAAFHRGLARYSGDADPDALLS